MKMFVLFACLAAASATTLVRAPSHDSAVIQSHRFGGNFAYRSDEAHAYAAINPVVSTVRKPVGVSYTQGAPIVRSVSVHAPIAAAPIATGYAAGLGYAGHGLGYAGHGLGYAGHGLGYAGHGLGYAAGLGYAGHGLAAVRAAPIAAGLGYAGHGYGYAAGLGYAGHGLAAVRAAPIAAGYAGHGYASGLGYASHGYAAGLGYSNGLYHL